MCHKLALANTDRGIPRRSVIVVPAVKTTTLPMVVVSAFAIAFGSLAVAPSASADACSPRGVGYTGTCDGGGGAPPSYFGPMITGSQTSVGSVDGINCTIKNAHRCRAHAQLGGTYIP